MWALVVAVSLMLNGSLFEDKMTYKVTAWPTEQECKDFVASAEGQASLANLRLYLVANSDDGNVTMDPVCTLVEGTS